LLLHFLFSLSYDRVYNCLFRFFDDIGRAMELCEDDLLMRFMHGPKDDNGNVIDSGVSIATAPTDASISSSEASHLRKAQYNLTDEEFFNLEEMQGLPSEIIDYATVLTAPRGHRIFQASHNHNCFYLIRQGVVEVRAKRPPGSRAAGQRWGSKGATHMEMIGSFVTQVFPIFFCIDFDHCVLYSTVSRVFLVDYVVLFSVSVVVTLSLCGFTLYLCWYSCRRLNPSTMCL
jgi:hypothetical protein